jgi:NAD(P) transhydrogenase subunit alpha
MRVGVVVEPDPEERRVALVPSVLPTLAQSGLSVLLQQGAGEKAGFPDVAYQEQGAQLAPTAEQVLAEAAIVAYVHAPTSPRDRPDLEQLRPGQVVVGFLDPLGSPRGIGQLAGKGVTALALELLPRISRAQPMDVLTAMATVAGYKAVLLAAATLPRMFPLLMTAAGTITPARVLVLGAGVAGLQAIATARRLGAVVQAHDVRPTVQQEVESLGARFLTLALETREAEGAGGYARELGEEFYRRQRELLAAAVADADVVITTAAVPGKPAPRLIDAGMVARMRPGCVIVDLAAETGGNCELTHLGQTVVAHGVTILGPRRLAATVPCHASQLYARSLAAFLGTLVKDGRLHLNQEDAIIRETLVADRGEVVHPRVRERLGLPPLAG